MRPAVSINVSWGGVKTLGALSRTIARRMKYLNESAFSAIHATAVNALQSIRAVTKVAKAANLKVAVMERTDLVLSYCISCGHRRMCLRTVGGARYTPINGVKVRYADVHGVSAKMVKVYEFVDDGSANKSIYLIAARSAAIARKIARQIVASRLLRFAGLAKRAVSALMIKANNRGPADAVNARVYAKANEVTSKREVIAKSSNGGGKYGLFLYDDLRYATAATCLRGGQSAVDVALKRAMNKTVGVIQKRCKDLLLPGELPLPFPEVKRRAA